MRRWLAGFALVAGCATAPTVPDPGPLYAWRGVHPLGNGTAVTAVDLWFDGMGGIERRDRVEAGGLGAVLVTHGRYVVDAYCCVTVDYEDGLQPVHFAAHTLLFREGPALVLHEVYGVVWRFLPDRPDR